MISSAIHDSTAQAAKATAPNPALLRRVIEEAKRRLRKSSVGLMNENINPLWNIDAKRAQMIFDFARSGNYAQLQYLYNEIEERDPALLVCVTRRTSALAELDWRVVRSDQRLYRNADENLVKEQIECVETAIAKIDNFPDVLAHLALSAFRGFSMVAPVHDAAGDIVHCDLVDSWNLCYDKAGQSWYFNPSGQSYLMPSAPWCAGSQKGLQQIPFEQVCVVRRARPIDWPALQIYLRAAVGERDWGRYLETYGLPPVIITMPPMASKADEDSYVAAAEHLFEGRTGVVPNGSEVHYASESRGTNPFTEFIEHQMKLIVMMATGGTLASLAEAQGIGSGASDTQQDEWLRIVRADKRIISNAINKQICERLIRRHKDFKDKPIFAEFQLNSDPKLSAKELAELAQSFSNAGFEMDAEELSRLSGYSIRKKDAGGTGFNSQRPGNMVETAGNSPSNAFVVVNKAKIPPKEETPQTPETEAAGAKLVRSLQADFKDVADRLNAILAKPEAERAGEAMKLLGELDSLVPDDPAMTEVIREQMEEAFQEQLAKQPEGDAPAANRTMPN